MQALGLKTYECGCCFEESDWDRDQGPDFAGYWLKVAGWGSELRYNPYPKAHLCKVIALMGLLTAMMNEGWCVHHASDVEEGLSRKFVGLHYILQVGDPTTGGLVTAEWFPTWEAALTKWNSYMKTLEDMGIG